MPLPRGTTDLSSVPIANRTPTPANRTDVSAGSRRRHPSEAVIRQPVRNHSDLWEMVSGHTTDGRATFAADEVKALALSVARRVDDLVACGWPVPTIVHEVCRDHATSSNPVSVARWRLTQIPTATTPPPRLVRGQPTASRADEAARRMVAARRYASVLLLAADEPRDQAIGEVVELCAARFGADVAEEACAQVLRERTPPDPDPDPGTREKPGARARSEAVVLLLDDARRQLRELRGSDKAGA